MSYDGITTKNILIELKNNLINARVEKIYVPNKNEVFFNFHTQNRENLKLLISIDANNGRIHFSNQSKDNPVKAPQICMIFRKHLQGARLISIEQYNFDRIIIFRFENLNELGDLVKKKLIVELMGKYSNMILLDDKEKIIDSMRHVDITMSSVREVLPGRDYVLPGTLGKVNFIDVNFSSFKEKLFLHDISLPLANIISNTFIGFSNSFTSSLLESLDFSSTKLDDLTNDDLHKIHEKLDFIFTTLEHTSFEFKSINSKDYTLNINLSCSENLKLSMFLDEFYSKKEKVSLIKTAKSNLQRDINTHLSKLNKKLSNVNEILVDSKNLEKYKQYGELLNCNMHLLKIGMEKISVQNFYDNNNLIDIPLQSNISPSQNAQNYFRRYTKLKSSISHALEYKQEYESNINYLNSVLYELETAENLSEIDEIKEELISQSYISKPIKSNRKKADLPSEPIKYEFNDIEILVGRNNIQNDRLTFKIAKKSYTWLHTKKIHGSHVIIKSENITNDLLLYAANLAVKHSQAKNSSKVEVDYTLVKYVHKENGAKPGMVVYTDYHTVII